MYVFYSLYTLCRIILLQITTILLKKRKERKKKNMMEMGLCIYSKWDHFCL